MRSTFVCSFKSIPPGLRQLLARFSCNSGESAEQARRRCYRRLFGILWVGHDLMCNIMSIFCLERNVTIYAYLSCWPNDNFTWHDPIEYVVIPSLIIAARPEKIRIAIVQF